MLELHRRWSKKGVHVFAVHPGNVIATGLSRHWWMWRVLFFLLRPFAKSVVGKLPLV
jgi:WW domain-containing oxidoreductase